MQQELLDLESLDITQYAISHLLKTLGLDQKYGYFKKFVEPYKHRMTFSYMRTVIYGGWELGPLLPAFPLLH